MNNIKLFLGEQTLSKQEFETLKGKEFVKFFRQMNPINDQEDLIDDDDDDDDDSSDSESLISNSIAYKGGKKIDKRNKNKHNKNNKNNRDGDNNDDDNDDNSESDVISDVSAIDIEPSELAIMIKQDNVTRTGIMVMNNNEAKTGQIPQKKPDNIFKQLKRQEYDDEDFEIFNPSDIKALMDDDNNNNHNELNHNRKEYHKKPSGNNINSYDNNNNSFKENLINNNLNKLDQLHRNNHDNLLVLNNTKANNNVLLSNVDYQLDSTNNPNLNNSNNNSNNISNTMNIEIKEEPEIFFKPSDILEIIGYDEKDGDEIYKLSDLYLPSNQKIYNNVIGYMYTKFMRDPKTMLNKSGIYDKLEKIKKIEDDNIKLFKQNLQHQRIIAEKYKKEQQQQLLTDHTTLNNITHKQKQKNLNDLTIPIIKETPKNPFSLKSNLTLCKLNKICTNEFFENLKFELLKNLNENYHIENEYSEEYSQEEEDNNNNNNLNGNLDPTHHHGGGGIGDNHLNKPTNGFFSKDDDIKNIDPGNANYNGSGYGGIGGLISNSISGGNTLQIHYEKTKDYNNEHIRSGDNSVKHLKHGYNNSNNNKKISNNTNTVMETGETPLRELKNYFSNLEGSSSYRQPDINREDNDLGTKMNFFDDNGPDLNKLSEKHMQEFLRRNYDKDKEALYDFYQILQKNQASMNIESNNDNIKLGKKLTLQGNKYNEKTTKKPNINDQNTQINKITLWGEPKNIEDRYIRIPFQPDEHSKIFCFNRIDDDNNINGNSNGNNSTITTGITSIIHKKRKLNHSQHYGKHNDNDIDPNLDISYVNKHVLENTWAEFFLKSNKNMNKNDEKLEEYSKIIIDMNDNKLFYESIHPIFYNMKRLSKLRKKAYKHDILKSFLATGNGGVGGVSGINGSGINRVGVNGDNEILEDNRDIVVGASSISGDITKTSQIKELGDKSDEPKRTVQFILDKNQKKELRIEAVRHSLDPEKLTQEHVEKLMKKSFGTKPDVKTTTDALNFEKDFKNKALRATVIQHSIVAEEFEFNEFLLKQQDLLHFHRPDIKKIFYRDMPWKLEIVKTTETRRKEDLLQEPSEKVDSFEHFKNHKRLSLKEGQFALFEFMEENPLIMTNVGMNSRLSKYIYSNRVRISNNSNANANTKSSTSSSGPNANANTNPPNQQQPAQITINKQDEEKKFLELIYEKFGPNGSINFLKPDQKLPLIGQLTNEDYIGISIIENNLYYAPVFIQKAPMTDFVMVRHVQPDGNTRYFLRKIEYIYTVGQIEPKLEVFTPQSRSLKVFIKKCLKFIIKKKFSKNEPINIKELTQIFPSLNEHMLRKTIRELGGDQDPHDSKTFFFNKEILENVQEDEEERNEGNITPEDACLFEKMHSSLARLKHIGIQELRSCDKINTVKNKFTKRNMANPEIKKEEALKYNIVANLIAEELQLTSWNLSQSFLAAKQKQGRMYLKGFGDPTNGHGGYSYVKRPLKTSRYEKEEKKAIEDKSNMVTGTDADLRKLPMKYVDKTILKYGKYNQEYLGKLTRWEKINLLREISSEHPNDEEVAKYARLLRVTTKMQLENYQKDINELFKTLVDNLSTPLPPQDEGDEEIQIDVEAMAKKELANNSNNMNNNSLLLLPPPPMLLTTASAGFVANASINFNVNANSSANANASSVNTNASANTSVNTNVNANASANVGIGQMSGLFMP